MPQTGRHPARVRATLVAACYVFVLLAGALTHHHEASGRHPHSSHSHCAVCACLDAPPFVTAVAAPSPARLVDAGAAPTPRDGAERPARAVGLSARAPPSTLPVIG